MSSSRVTSSVKTSQPKKNYRKAQAASDARLELGFEEKARLGQPSTWDYLKSVVQQTQLIHKKGAYNQTKKEVESDTFVSIPAYIQHVQRPGFIQPHGTLLLLERNTLKILALAENLFDYLDPDLEEGEAMADMLERDVFAYFSPQSIKSIKNALQFSDLSLANPISVKTAKTNRKLYAILHAVDEGIVMDLEPLWNDEAIGGDVIAIDKHSRVSASIGKLQSLPTNDVHALCDTLVKEIKSLTGYDRIMVYKFHEDQHGEVIAEAKEDCLAPLLGLHYPANDVPQANRQLFVDVRLRMISDTEAGNVNIIQSPSLSGPIPLSRSTMRGVAGCHKQYSKNMGCRATLVMAVVVNTEPTRFPFLWGLVCCHHHSGPRVISYPQRYACDFLIQAFALQLSMEIEAADDAREKRVMQMQAVLCGLLTRDAPLGLIRQSPTIKDLIPADGAVLLHGDKAWSLGNTPTEEQVIDIANWLEDMDHESLEKGVFYTDSLENAGYPNAQDLAPAVCGLAATQVSSRGDFLMWFRSGFSKQITWAGHKDLHNVKEGVSMHPRHSFDAFLEVARLRSPPWHDAEINAIQGLKLIVQDSLPESGPHELRLKIQTRLNAERLSIQNQLMEVARSLKIEMETAKVPIIGLSGNGNVCEWNVKAAELTGRSREEVIGKNFMTELLAVESYDEFNNIMDLVGEGEELEPLEMCIRSRNALDDSLTRKVFLLASLYAHHDSHGNLLGVRIVGQDITPLKILSGEYAVAGEEASSLLNSSDMLVFAIDEGGKVNEWNSAMEKISGLKKENVIGKKLIGEVLSNSPMLFVPEPDSLVLFEVALCQALRGEDSKNHELHFQTCDGKQMDTLMHIIGSRKDEKGEILGATCFMQDLLQRKAAENASAVRMVAEAASQAKTMQLACLCHEIRNPLNGILSSISFMEDTEMTSEQRELVITTASCGKYLRRVVDDVLDLSKIEEGKLEIDSESFSLMHVVDAVVAQEASNAYDKGLQLYCVTDPACIDVIVKGDGLRLQQIAANFCRNAIEYTERGWVEIKLKAMAAQKEGNLRFVLSVSDSGKGLTPSQLETVFSMPESLSMDGGDKSYGGAGLGLVVCTKLAHLMDGRVSCESKEGVGSSFSLDLELALVDSSSADSQNENLEESLLGNRLKGVIYSIVGEWSTEEEIANADILSPTVSAMFPNLSSVVPAEADDFLTDEPMVDDVEGFLLHRGNEYDSPATILMNRGVGEIGGYGRREEDASFVMNVEEGEEEEEEEGMEEEMRCSNAEAFAAVRDMEQIYGARLAVQIVREVVDANEVAVLVEVVDEATGEQVTSIQQWGSAERSSSLGEALRSATRNAVIAASQNFSPPMLASVGW
uniref:histidine kinase n=1 Tax=Spirogyra varians TaxID=332125 RepID=A0A3G5EAS4_9VIRI|nr:phytochrome [Spirogyra varians]